MKITDIGILLHRFNYADTSLIITYFTRESGIRKFIFKGGKKKNANLFPLSVSELTYYSKKDDQLSNLTSADSALQTNFQFDPIRSSVAFFIAEMLNKSCAIGQPDQELYRFILETVEELDKADKVSLLPLKFSIGLTRKHGFYPQCKDADHSVFNLESGTFQMTGSLTTSRSGEGVDLIKEYLLNEEFGSTVKRSARKDSLKIMLDYFRLHVPNFEKLDSFEVVQELLNG